MSSYEDRVCKLIQDRAKLGLAKYGVSLERTDLDLCDWLQHLQDELLDAANYVERLKDELCHVAKGLGQLPLPLDEDAHAPSDEGETVLGLDPVEDSTPILYDPDANRIGCPNCFAAFDPANRPRNCLGCGCML